MIARAEALDIIRQHVEDWQTVFNAVLAYDMIGSLSLLALACEPYADLIEGLAVEELLDQLGDFAGQEVVLAFADQIPEDDLLRLAKFLRFFYHMARPK